MGIDADKYWIQPPNMNPKWEWIGMVKNHGMKIERNKMLESNGRDQTNVGTEPTTSLRRIDQLNMEVHPPNLGLQCQHKWAVNYQT